MRKYLNLLLSPLGYELRRLDPFEVQFAALAKSGTPPKFVQVGANDGVRFDGLYAKVTQHNCSGLAIEPLPDAFERLRFNYADYPHVALQNVAVHTSLREVDLYRVAPDAVRRYPDWAKGIASFDRRHLLSHGVSDSDIATERVPAAPLMEILESNNCLDANVLQIDVEGYDAEVIRMIDFHRFHPALIKFEHKGLEDSDLHAVCTMLHRHGYRTAALDSDTVAWLKP